MEKIKINFTSLFFISYLIIFVFDSVINYYTKIPVFVSFSMLFIPLSILVIKPKPNNETNLYILFVVLLLISTGVNIFRFSFSIKNISDLIFILIFATTIMLYNNNKNHIKSKYIDWFSVVCLIMFYITFLGVDNTRWGNTLNSGSHDIEYLRAYKQGLFRIAHIAAYFFTFLGFYYLYLYNKFKKIKHFTLLCVMFLSVVMVGSRAPIFAVLLGFGLASLRLKYIKHIMLLIFLIILIILNIDIILELTKGTIVFQYFSIFKTFISNFGRLSRVLIWTSFFEELAKFNFFDYIFGRGTNNAMLINEAKGLGKIWFHNDFLNIFYSFGMISFVLYIFFYMNIYRVNKLCMNNTIIRTLFFTIIMLAFFNGFYLYYVMFPLYIFYKILSVEEKIK